MENAQLIEMALDRFVQCGCELIKVSNSKTDVKLNQEAFRQFFERMFEMVNSIMDETFKKRESGEYPTILQNCIQSYANQFNYAYFFCR